MISVTVHVTLGGALERVGELAAATFQQALVFTIGRRPGGRKQPLESFPNWPNLADARRYKPHRLAANPKRMLLRRNADE